MKVIQNVGGFLKAAADQGEGYRRKKSQQGKQNKPPERRKAGRQAKHTPPPPPPPPPLVQGLDSPLKTTAFKEKYDTTLEFSSGLSRQGGGGGSEPKIKKNFPPELAGYFLEEQVFHLSHLCTICLHFTIQSWRSWKKQKQELDQMKLQNQIH